MEAKNSVAVLQEVGFHSKIPPLWRLAVGLRFAIGPLVPFLFGSWFGASLCNRVPTWRMMANAWDGLLDLLGGLMQQSALK